MERRKKPQVSTTHIAKSIESIFNLSLDWYNTSKYLAWYKDDKRQANSLISHIYAPHVSKWIYTCSFANIFINMVQIFCTL